MAETAHEYIKLKSKQEELFEVEKNTAFRSVTIKNMVEDTGMDICVPIPMVESRTLVKVIEFLKYHHKAEEETIPEDEQTRWDKDYIKVIGKPSIGADAIGPEAIGGAAAWYQPEMERRGLPSAKTSCTAWKLRPGCTVKNAMEFHFGSTLTTGSTAGVPGDSTGYSSSAPPSSSSHPSSGSVR